MLRTFRIKRVHSVGRRVYMRAECAQCAKYILFDNKLLNVFDFITNFICMIGFLWQTMEVLIDIQSSIYWLIELWRIEGRGEHRHHRTSRYILLTSGGVFL